MQAMEEPAWGAVEGPEIGPCPPHVLPCRLTPTGNTEKRDSQMQRAG